MKSGNTFKITFKITSRVAALVAAGFAVLAAPAAAQDFEWTGNVAAGGTVEIRGINGDIEARPASGSMVRVVADKTARRSDEDDVRIEVIEHDGGVTICAVYPDVPGKSANECGPGRTHSNTRDNDVVVDFTVFVPSGLDFDANTVNGEISATNIGGDVDANTVNGDIDVSATGTVEANTVNGSIDASTGSASWSGTLDFHTVNGSITLTLPAGTNASVEGETVNGGIQSDFPITIEPGSQWGPKRFSGRIGEGGGRLELETVNGGIELRQS